jgi:catechol 2,3-dioxygenase-like lactoylglutathione lyase family enzyme
MKNRTITVHVGADRNVVFAFLAQIENLPVWAAGWCSDLRREEGLWRATTPGGPTFLEMEADERTGVIDLFVGVQPDEMTLIPFRVVVATQGTAIIGTLFQPPDWSDDLYEKQYGILLICLRGLATKFAGGYATASAFGAEPFYPSLVTAKFYETWDFYAGHLGFRTVWESDVYVHLVHECGAQIGVLRHELNGDTSELVSATDGRGYWLNLDVADADAEYARLRGAGADIATEIADKPWGDRQFMVRDPNGVLVAIAHRMVRHGTETMALAIN